MSDYIPIRVRSKVVGKVKDGTFYKNVFGSRHFLRNPRAIANDIQGLDQAELVGAVRVQIFDVETGTTYRATIAHIRRAGFELDRGYGRQIALVMDGWTITRRGESIQLSLFGA